MKKVKLAFIAMAILFSVGGAFATRAHSDCRLAEQYYFNGKTYIPAGIEGYDYDCLSGSSNCTYILVGSNFQTCQLGSYLSLQ